MHGFGASTAPLILAAVLSATAGEPFYPNDPYFFADMANGFTGQWHLDRQDTGAVVDINVVPAWARGLTGEGVTIGIVERGMDHTHPDLAPNYEASRSWDFADDDPDPMPVRDEESHATPVGGVAAARGGDNFGTTGVAPMAGLASLRSSLVTPYSWSSLAAYHAQHAEAVRHSISENVIVTDILNHSYGSSLAYLGRAEDEHAAIRESADAGVINVVAAGNHREYSTEDPGGNWVEPYNQTDGDSGKKYLAPLPEVIAVAAVNDQGRFTPYSSFGACVFVSTPAGGRTSENRFRLIGPDREGAAGYNSRQDIDWTFTSNAFWGEDPNGTWTLAVRDVYISRDDSNVAWLSDWTPVRWDSYAITMRSGE